MTAKRKVARLKHLDLGPHKIAIVREDMRKEGLLGQARYDDSVVRLDAALVGMPLTETLVHEVLHLAADAVNFDLPETAIKPMAIFVTQMLAPLLDLSPIEGG